MIIYCAGPIKGDTTYQNSYQEIINFIDTLGHTALAELNGKFNSTIPLTDNQIFKRDIKWIDGSDLMVAEISGPSLGVGFEIAYALFEKKIPVLALASKEVVKLSAMITGCDSELLTLERYGEVEEMHSKIFNYLKQENSRSDGTDIHLTLHRKDN